MSDRQLESDGTVTVVSHDVLKDARVFELEAGADTDAIQKSAESFHTIALKFVSSADGRGFSLAAALREKKGNNSRLIALGQLNPDQVSMAFQCGFDAVMIDAAQWDRYGEDAWVSTLDPIVNRSYMRSRWEQLDSIWASRTR